MKNQALVKKYAEGLARALKDEREYESAGAEIGAFLGLYASREDLRKSLVSPFVNARDKAAILGEVLSRLGTGPKASRFLSLLLQHKRLELLPAVAAALPEAWSDMHGVVSFVLRHGIAHAGACLLPSARHRRHLTRFSR